MTSRPATAASPTRPTPPRVASLIRWLRAHQQEIEAIPYGQLAFDWRPGDVKVKLTRASSVPLALDPVEQQTE